MNTHPLLPSNMVDPGLCNIPIACTIPCVIGLTLETAARNRPYIHTRPPLGLNTGRYVFELAGTEVLISFDLSERTRKRFAALNAAIHVPLLLKRTFAGVLLTGKECNNAPLLGEKILICPIFPLATSNLFPVPVMILAGKNGGPFVEVKET